MRTLLSLWPHPSVTLATQSRSGPHCLLTSWPFSLSFRVLSIVYHTAAMLLTFILIIISIPPPRHSFIPGLNLPFSANSSHCSLPFLLQDWLHGFPGLFTDTSDHIRLYMNKNILSCMNLQEDQSVSFLFFFWNRIVVDKWHMSFLSPIQRIRVSTHYGFLTIMRYTNPGTRSLTHSPINSVDVLKWVSK